MGRKTIVTLICDRCKEEIDQEERYINAETYGFIFHVLCFTSMSAHELVRLLTLDEIKIMVDGRWEDAEKIYAKNVSELTR